MSARPDLCGGHRAHRCPYRDHQLGFATIGIAAVLADDDSIAEHIQDTLIAGAGLRQRPGHGRQEDEPQRDRVFELP